MDNITREDLKEFIQPLSIRLDKIEDKLDRNHDVGMRCQFHREKNTIDIDSLGKVQRKQEKKLWWVSALVVALATSAGGFAGKIAGVLKGIP